MKHHCKYILLLLLGLVGLVACESADCTLYNIVSLHVTCYSAGKKVAITDTLTITALGTDSVLLNKSLNTSTMELPMSYTRDKDVYILHVFSGDTLDVADTVSISKTNREHFESPDCASNMFHEITDIQTTHHFIDSISITRQSVNYDQTENIQIHLYGTD